MKILLIIVRRRRQGASIFLGYRRVSSMASEDRFGRRRLASHRSRLSAIFDADRHIRVWTRTMDSATIDALPADALPAPFAEALDRAEHDKARITLTRNGKPVAVLVPMEDVEALEAWEDAEDARLAAQAHAAWEEAGRPTCVTLEELAARHGIDLSAAPE